MASPTRIQEKSRHAKKVIGSADYDLNGGTVTNYVGKPLRADKHGYPAYKGIAYPVLVGLTITDSTP